MELSISNKSFDVNISLPFSKSESNRLLILQALSEGEFIIENLSDANDTKILSRALASKLLTVDVEDAGTAARFFVAYACIINKHIIITGSRRMQERPIEPLVNALKQLGFRIQYLRQNGFLPIEILPVNMANVGDEIAITGKISSQFITALMLVGWKLPNGLTIIIIDEYTSHAYILLTQKLMQKCGIEVSIDGNKIRIPAQQISAASVAVTADWTNAGYWYSFVALSDNGRIKIEGLDIESFQGDKAIVEISSNLGVKTTSENSSIVLTKTDFDTSQPLHFDFNDNPDLAQTIIVLCAAKNIAASFSGLHTLKLKETDRIISLRNELQKFNVEFIEESPDLYKLKGQFKFEEPVQIETYNDHRMAMAFAPLALINKIIIEDIEVVNKSYPKFWEEVEKLKKGF
jgi:3-phosphoshikimate 1-carboxyvinyltransferase